MQAGCVLTFVLLCCPNSGSITAALYLEEFLQKRSQPGASRHKHKVTPWLHMDMNGSNSSNRPGRPEGRNGCVGLSLVGRQQRSDMAWFRYGSNLLHAYKQAGTRRGCAHFLSSLRK